MKVRNLLSSQKLLRRIPEDLEWIFDVDIQDEELEEQVGDLWEESGNIQGGKNWGDERIT